MKKFKEGDIICGIFPKSFSGIKNDKYYWIHSNYNPNNRKYPTEGIIRLKNGWINNKHHDAMADNTYNVHIATKKDMSQLFKKGYVIRNTCFYKREWSDNISILKHGTIHIEFCALKSLKKQQFKTMKEIKIETPKGYIIDKEQSTFEKIIFKKIEKELPESWEELKKISGYYISTASNIKNYEYNTCNLNKNTFRTIQQAKSSIAMAQLSQLMYVYNDGWEANWGNANTKYILERVNNNNIGKSNHFREYQFLAFKTPEIRDKFLENFRDLIEEYFMIE